MKFVNDKEAVRKRSKCQCLVYGCTCIHGKGTPLCNKHKAERKKENNPLAYWFGVLRRNAKRRHKLFTITIEDFKEFCDETKYLELKGRNVGNMSIDRKIDELGYIPGNIQIMEHGANVRKKYTDYWMRQEQQWQEPPMPEEDWERRPITTNETPPF